ncbi:hypothetical protein [Streptococcus dentiloxodontae]
MINWFKTKAKQDRLIEKEIAEEFSSKYITPNGNEIFEIAFYASPSTPKDFTGSRYYG